MNFLKKLFKAKSEDDHVTPRNYLIITLNDKIMPVDRGDVYEDPLDEFIQQAGIGEVCGGGTMQQASGEIDFCNVDIQLYSDGIDEKQLIQLQEKSEELGAPKGSFISLQRDQQKIMIGKKEGLAIYLDGVNLDNEVYENCDSNFVVDEIRKRINDISEIVRFWESDTETALYFYSDSFEEMKSAIQDFVETYPLCKNARIERIA